MASKRESDSESKRTRRPPATTPEALENQLVADAMDLAAKQIRDGTASAQVVTHFLRLGSTREKLEQTKIEADIVLAKAKAEHMAAVERIEGLFEEAISAMRRYSGQEPPQGSEEYAD